MKLLIVEDEKQLLQSISQYLQKEGFVCEQASDYFTAEEKLTLYEYDIVVLDITLPDGNGLDLLNMIRKEYQQTGIMIVSARNSLDDKLKGLDLGADDYITKPFHLAELNSRINAIIRRRIFQGQSNIIFNEIEIDPTAKEVTVNNNLLDLTKKEYMLLLYFITNKNRVLTKEAIAEHLWGDNIDMVDNFDFVYTHIKNMRKKIEVAGGTDYLLNIYGMGYKYTNR
ncbi:MAG: response regulator transcription factor [Ignavibacteria bacterium]|nr:response regulator transcription factor [Ignavibacteria bacterium]